MKNSVTIQLLLGLALCGLTSPALAASGAIELDQRCATITGCAAGDAPGFPITLSDQAGHAFLLTSDLQVAGFTHAIEITGTDMALDLGGHVIRGPVTCSGVPPTTPIVCESGPGNVAGIQGLTRGNNVHRGRVTGFSGYGINLGDVARVRDVVADGNDGIGVRAGMASLVQACSAHHNANGGFWLSHGTLVGNVHASENSNFGLYLRAGSLATRIQANENDGDGVRSIYNAHYSDITAYENADAGIEVGTGSYVVDVSSGQNGGDGVSLNKRSMGLRIVSGANDAVGIGAGIDGALISGVARSNFGDAISLGAGTTFRESAGDEVDAGVDMGANECTNTACP